MGRVTTTIKVENLRDVVLAEEGTIPRTAIRTVEIEALVDTGATALCLTLQQISTLGLVLRRVRTVSTANGVVERGVYGSARLTILERDCLVDVMEIPEGIPALVGYVPLELLDLVPDPKTNKLIPNPDHGGEVVWDLY